MGTLLKNILPTVIEGVRRAFKINTSEITPDEMINDAVAKAIKSITRLVILVILIKLFPDIWKELWQFVQSGL